MAVEEQLETSRLQALGMVETYGLTASVEAVNTMLKMADVKLAGSEKIDVDLATVMVQGDVGVVKTTTEAGAEATSKVGECVFAHVIPRPRGSVGVALPQAK